MKTKIVISLFLGIFIISCKDNKPSSISELFSKTPHFSITSRIFPVDSLFIGNVYSMVGINNILILLDEYNDKYISLIDIENKKLVARFGNKGRGPNEIADPTNLYIDKGYSTLYVSLMNPDRMIKYVIDSVINRTTYNFEEITKFDFKDEVLFNAAMLYGENKYIATGMFHNGKYGITDEYGVLDTVIGDYIRNEKLKSIDNYKLGNVFQGIIKSHPDGNKVVCATTSCDLIEVIDTKSYEIKRFYSYLPITKKDKQFPVISRNSRRGYVALQVTSNYIYAVFSGRTYARDGNKAFGGNKLYVFDWDLNPVCSYSLKQDINCMYVTDDDKTMYSVITLDEPVLVKYDLKHVK